MKFKTSARQWGRGAVIGFAFLAAGCSQVPDAVNPVEWYRSASDLVTGTDRTDPKNQSQNKTSGTTTPDRPIPGAARPVPNLATVPERPQAPSARERARLEEGLVGDRAQARYTGEEIRRQGDAPEPPPPLPQTRPAPPASASVASAPAPTQRLTQAPVAAPAPVAAATSPAAPPPPPPVPTQASAPPPLPPATTTTPAPALASIAQPAEFETTVVSSAGIQTASRVAPIAPAALAERASVEPLAPRGALVKLATIYFVHGSARLSEDEREILQDVATIQRQRGGAVRIVGHASSRTASMDPTEHDRVNLDMSAERAGTIAEELARNGVPRTQIVTVARADAEPVFFEVMPSGEAGNRRAEIYLEAAGGR